MTTISTNATTAELYVTTAKHIETAKKILMRHTLWGALRSKESVCMDAAHEYKKAANICRFINDWRKAYKYYMLAAKYAANDTPLSSIDHTKHTALQFIEHAAYCIDKYDKARACTLHATLATIYAGSSTITGFDAAAKQYIKAAQQCNGENAIKYYETAVAYYATMDNNIHAMNDLLEKIGLLQQESGDYMAASQTYKKAADNYILAGNLRFYSIINSLFNSIVCLFNVDDVVLLRAKYNEYCNILYGIATTPQFIFIDKLISCIEKYEDTRFVDCNDTTEETQETDNYTNKIKMAADKYATEYQYICYTYDRATPLTSQQISALLHQLHHMQYMVTYNLDL